MNGSGKLAEADLRALGHHGNILDAQRRAVLGRDDRVFDVLHIPYQSHFTNVDLLQARFDEAAAGVDIVVA